MQRGELRTPPGAACRARSFFEHRLIPDITHAYYAHPIAWNEIGFGGPASPRGYVRMDFDRRDPWEAAEAKPGDEEQRARKNNHVRLTPFAAAARRERPRARRVQGAAVGCRCAQYPRRRGR